MKGIPSGSRFDLKTGVWRTPSGDIVMPDGSYRRSEQMPPVISESREQKTTLVYRPKATNDGPACLLQPASSMQSIDIDVVRPENAPSFERIVPQLQDGARGLILGPALKLKNRSIIMSKNGISPIDIRFGLLFWEYLAVPKGNAVDFYLGPDADLLIEQGILFRPRVFMTERGGVGHLVSLQYSSALENLSAQDGDRWSIERNAANIKLVGSSKKDYATISFDLHNALAVVKEDVHIHDILDFKLKRKSELLSLRHELDQVYAAIANSPDIDLERDRSVARLKSALQDHQAVMAESKMPFLMSSPKAKIDFKTWASAASVFEYMQLRGVPTALSAAAAIGGGILASTSVELSRRKPRNTSNPFEYVAQFSKLRT